MFRDIMMTILFSIMTIVLTVTFATAGEDVHSADGTRLPAFIPVQEHYDSGLQSIAPGTHLITHNLGGDPSRYLVFVYGYNSYGYHQANYGTAPFNGNDISYYGGLEWMELNDRDMKLLRAPGDDRNLYVPVAKQWDKVRVLIFKVGPSQVGIHRDGHFHTEVNMTPGQKKTITHNLGGDPGNYMVYAYGLTTKGYHHGNYGTSPTQFIPAKWIGFEWQELNSSNITLVRASHDDDVGFERKWSTVSLLIIRTDPNNSNRPFIPLHSYFKNQGDGYPGVEDEWDHWLGGFAGYYLVHVYGYNSYGYHQANYGTVPFYFPQPFVRYRGCEWFGMDDESITLFRGPDDADPLVPYEKRWNDISVFMIRPK